MPKYKNRAALEQELEAAIAARDEAEALSGRATQKLIAAAKEAAVERDALTCKINELRDRLMEATRESERMRGYLDRIEDEKPPVMVPQPREPRWQDASAFHGASYGYDGVSTPQRKWWHL